MTRKPHPLPTERCSNRLAQLRASVAADRPPTGPVQRTILLLFEILLMMLAAWTEKALAAAAAEEVCATGLANAPYAAGAAPLPHPIPPAKRGRRFAA